MPGSPSKWFKEQIFNGLGFVFIYIDNIIVASKSCKEHIIHLREVLNRLRSAGLVLNLSKCNFGHSSVDFQGHLASSQGINTLAAKELQQFLGLLNFYRRFLPSTTKVLTPLTDALKGSPVGPTRIQCSTAMLAAFNLAKDSLSTLAELSYHSP